MSAPGQLAFALPVIPSYRQEDFCLSPCNREAYAWITRWPDWPAHGLMLIGPPAAGKTHLARIWQECSGAGRWRPGDHPAAVQWPLLIERGERLEDEQALFHLLNLARERHSSLLITTEISPRDWGVRLPDLASRLNSLPQVTLNSPDEELLEAVLAKHFADRQVEVDAEVLRYAVSRSERSLAAVKALAERLDAAGLEAGRRISLKLARQVLQEEMPLFTGI